MFFIQKNNGASLWRRKILRLPSKKGSNDKHKRGNILHTITPINTTPLLVRRKILRLYF